MANMDFLLQAAPARINSRLPQEARAPEGNHTGAFGTYFSRTRTGGAPTAPYFTRASDINDNGA